MILYYPHLLQKVTEQSERVLRFYKNFLYTVSCDCLTVTWLN